MTVSTLWACGCAFALSWVLTWWVRRVALARGLLDQPNDRSSHSIPTPRVGGIAIVIAASAGMLLLLGAGQLDLKLAIALIGGGSAIAAVGFMDDRRRLSARVRFAVHVVAALWALMWLGGLPPLRIGGHITALGPAGYALGVLAIVWVLNLFNFMDGIDGIAASEAIFIVCGATLAAAATGATTGAALVLGAASGGFLLWNWPPAKIFMGDVGSAYLGYLIGVLAVAATRDDAAAVWIWLTLGGVFFVDATATLIRRTRRIAAMPIKDWPAVGPATGERPRWCWPSIAAGCCRAPCSRSGILPWRHGPWSWRWHHWQCWHFLQARGAPKREIQAAVRLMSQSCKTIRCAAFRFGVQRLHKIATFLTADDIRCVNRHLCGAFLGTNPGTHSRSISCC
jgi:Fuc2NAc and GlcNAc transferase